MFEHYTLKNKAKVYLITLSDTKSVTGQIMFPVGSRYESAKLNGASHFIEHLMFKGTKKRKNTLTLTREIDRLGAEYNAFTDKESTGYYIKADAVNAEVIVDILSDMLYNSLFDPKEMEREKGVVCEELKMYQDNPLMNIDSIFEQLMFNGSPLGWDIGGTPELVKSYDRAEVLKFRDTYYDPSAMIIIFAGAITPKLKTYIEKYFGAKPSKVKVPTTFKPGKFGSEAKSERIVVQPKKTDQVQMMLGWPSFNHQSKDQNTMRILNTILGGSMSSRLFIEVRERRGLAYVVGSGNSSYRDTGYAYVQAGLEPKNINKAIACIKNEIQKIVQKGVTARELADAKTHYRGRLTLAMEDSSSQASWYAKHALYGDRIYTPEERTKEIEKVTAKQVQDLAKKIFKPQAMRVAIIGDIDPKSVEF